MEQTVWTFKELVDHRISRRDLQRAMREGKVFKLFHGIYTNVVPTARTVWEALEKQRPNAIVEGASAIEIYQGKRVSLPVSVRVPTSNTGTGPPELLKLRRSRKAKFESRGGYRVVSLVDAIATCLKEGSVPESELRALAEVEFRSERGMRRLNSELKALGTQSKSEVREFLDSCIAGTDSGLEKRFVAALRELGFKTEQNVKVGGYKWDVCLRGLKVVIDLDSHKFHATGDIRTFIIDRWKTNDAQGLGWTAFRITDECFEHNFRDLVSMLKRIRVFRGKHPGARLTGIIQDPVWKWHQVLMGF